MSYTVTIGAQHHNSRVVPFFVYSVDQSGTTSITRSILEPIKVQVMKLKDSFIGAVAVKAFSAVYREGPFPIALPRLRLSVEIACFSRFFSTRLTPFRVMRTTNDVRVDAAVDAQPGIKPIIPEFSDVPIPFPAQRNVLTHAFSLVNPTSFAPISPTARADAGGLFTAITAQSLLGSLVSSFSRSHEFIIPYRRIYSRWNER